MTQRDEGHNYRDSKNKAIEYERKQKVDAQANSLIEIFCSYICDSETERFYLNDRELTGLGKDLLKQIKNNLKS
mgnify:FL=1